MDVDPSGALTTCLSNVVTLDLSSNKISTFPSVMIYRMRNLTNLNFQYNNLTDVPVNAFYNVSTLETIDFSHNHLTTFELWALDVKISADFSYNNISIITNTHLYISNSNRIIQQSVSLTHNAPVINFTDAVYEMYYQCDDVIEWFFNNTEDPSLPTFTQKLGYLDFGTTQISCSCDQRYFLIVFGDSFPGPSYPIKNATCAGSLENPLANMMFFNSNCGPTLHDRNSTVNFTQVYPRFCKCQETDAGGTTGVVAMTPPTSSPVRHIYK